MKYTYNIKNREDDMIYDALKKEISFFYRGFVLDEEIKDESGTFKAVFRNNNEKIFIIFDSLSEDIVLTSDFALDMLVRKYNDEIKDKRHYNTVVSDSFSRSIKEVKYLIIPLVLILIMLLSGGEITDLLWVILITVEFVITTGIAFLYVPAVVLTLYLAEKENKFLYKIPSAVLILLIMAEYLAAYTTPEDTVYYGRYFLEYIFNAIITIKNYTSFFYVILLPLLIADDIAREKYLRKFGTRPGIKHSAVIYVLTAVCLIVMTGSYSMYGYEQRRIHDAENEQRRQEEMKVLSENEQEICRMLYEKYGDDLKAAANYSAEHEYYNWEYCPDEDYEALWRRLFEDSGEADISEIIDHSIPGQLDFSVTYNDDPYRIIFTEKENGVYLSGKIYYGKAGE